MVVNPAYAPSPGDAHVDQLQQGCPDNWHRDGLHDPTGWAPPLTENLEQMWFLEDEKAKVPPQVGPSGDLVECR